MAHEFPPVQVNLSVLGNQLLVRHPIWKPHQRSRNRHGRSTRLCAVGEQENFAFITGRNNQWDISPAYDLTYMSGPGGYHTMTFAGGETQDPTCRIC